MMLPQTVRVMIREPGCAIVSEEETWELGSRVFGMFYGRLDRVAQLKGICLELHTNSLKVSCTGLGFPDTNNF